VEHIAGHEARARVALEEACSIYSAKGDRVSLARATNWGKLVRA
jgi:hypothetical protein